MKGSTFFSEHMSSQHVNRGEARPSEVTDGSTDGGPAAFRLQAECTWHRAQPQTQKMCERLKTKTTLWGWERTHRMDLSAAFGVGWGLTDSRLSDDIFKASGEEHKVRP